MGLLFVLLVVIAGVIFLTAPFWVAVGYAVVLAWNALLLYVVFHHADPVSRAVIGLLRTTEFP